MTEIATADRRFWEKVDRVASSGCRLWSGACTRNGYGMFWGDNKTFVLAHRWIYIRSFGAIPPGFQIDHTCHGADASCVGGIGCLHRRCVNPAHLEAVTPRENTHRSQSATSENFRKTHCESGHPFTEENTRWRKYAYGRACRACDRIRCQTRTRARTKPAR